MVFTKHCGSEHPYNNNYKGYFFQGSTASFTPGLTVWHLVVGFGRAIARWNRLCIKTMDRWEIFASRAPRVRSAR